MRNALLSLLLAVIFFSCSSSGNQRNTLYYNGVIYTCDTAQIYAQCMVVDPEGRILCVGNEADAKEYLGAKSTKIDLGGKLVLPGFTESHLHPCTGALFNNCMYLLNAEWTFDQIKEEVKRVYALHPNKELYLFQGYNVQKLKASPLAAHLDELIKEKPLLLIDDGFHTAIANSKALEQAGITAATSDPQPGLQYFGRDAAGNPSGSLIEFLTISQVMDKLDVVSVVKMKAWLEKFARHLNSLGFTSLFDAGAVYVNYDNCTQAYVELCEAGKLQMNVCRSYPGNLPLPPDTIIERMARCATQMSGFDRLRLNTLKLYLDGTIEANTSPMLVPLSGLERGNQNLLIDSLRLQALVVAALQRERDVHIHAIGDKAIKAALDVYRNNNAVGRGAKTICHNEIYPPGGMASIKGLQRFFFQTTPGWCANDGVTSKLLGEERMKRFFPVRSAMDAGATITFGSDYPASAMEQINPFYQIHWAVQRGEASNAIYGPVTEGVDVASAVAAYTLNGAKQLGIDSITGSITPGKYADFMVLDRNIFTIPLDSVKNTKVLSLYYRGVKAMDAAQ